MKHEDVVKAILLLAVVKKLSGVLVYINLI